MGLTLQEQLLYIKRHFPEAWEFLNEEHDAKLPKFDDDDEVIFLTKEESK